MNLLNLLGLLNLTRPSNTQTAGTQCLTGTVFITPTGLLGATTGFLSVQNTAVPIRQVPGPNNAGVPITQLNQQTALLCGTFIQDATGLTFNVTTAFPLPGSTGTGTGLGASL